MAQLRLQRVPGVAVAEGPHPQRRQVEPPRLPKHVRHLRTPGRARISPLGGRSGRRGGGVQANELVFLFRMWLLESADSGKLLGPELLRASTQAATRVARSGVQACGAAGGAAGGDGAPHLGPRGWVNGPSEHVVVAGARERERAPVQHQLRTLPLHELRLNHLRPPAWLSSRRRPSGSTRSTAESGDDNWTTDDRSPSLSRHSAAIKAT